MDSHHQRAGNRSSQPEDRKAMAERMARKPQISCVLPLLAAALAMTEMGICGEAEETTLDDRVKKAAELYRAKDYRAALTELHAIASEGKEAGKLEEYAAKARGLLGEDLGKAMASCRLLTKCKRCNGSGCPVCKTCKGLGCRNKKQAAKTKVTWTEVEKINVANVIRRKHKGLAVPWVETQPCKKCKGRGCRPCRTCDGTGRSLVKTGGRGSKTPDILDIERSDLVRELRAEGERALRGVSTADALGQFRPDQIDAQDVLWVVSAGKHFAQAEAISVAPSDRAELSQMARSASLDEAKFLETLKLRWNAASDLAKRQAEVELQRQADEERARHVPKDEADDKDQKE